jgi:hypothetical protein
MNKVFVKTEKFRDLKNLKIINIKRTTAKFGEEIFKNGKHHGRAKT